jgi:DNA-binding IclR family transcriptional regulator
VSAGGDIALSDLELMIVGVLTLGPARIPELATALAKHHETISRGLDRLEERERVVYLPKLGKWTLVVR